MDVRPKTRAPIHALDENLGAASVRFTPDELKEFREAFATIEIQGARAPESALTDL